MTRTKNVFNFGAALAALPVQKIQENGMVSMIIVDVPITTNAVTATVSIADIDGYVLYTSGALAAGITKIPSALITAEVEEIPLDFNYTMTCTLSGVAGVSGAIVNVMLYVKRNKP